MIEVDGVERIAAGLRSAGVRGGFIAARIVEQHAKQVQEHARSLAPRRGLPHYARTITYDVGITRNGVEAEIGPTTGGQGSLGHILERGTASSPPHAHLGPALDRVAPDFVKALAEKMDPLR